MRPDRTSQRSPGSGTLGYTVTGLVTDETEIDFEDESRCSGANEVRVLEEVEIYLPQP